jgi:hypothetical protein
MRNSTSTVGDLWPFSSWETYVRSILASKPNSSWEMPTAFRAFRRASPNSTLRRFLPAMPEEYRGRMLYCLLTFVYTIVVADAALRELRA